MINLSNNSIFELIYVIVNYGSGSKVLQKAKEHGIRGGTVLIGKGTVRNALLNFLSLYDERKEIVMLGTDTKTADTALVALDKDFHFEKPHHGIVFTTTTCSIIGSRCYIDETHQTERGVKLSMYQLIVTIVKRGKAEDVISAASDAGSKGGTIINARGSGVNETSRLFHMDIEPEKELVMILSKAETTEAIVQSIRNRLQLDVPGNGIVFIQDVSRAYGVFE